MLMRSKRQYILLGLIVAALIAVFFAIRPKNTTVSTPSLPTTATAQKAGPQWAYPDPSRTPGSTNPGITQRNIGETICNPDWSTRSIRPPESYTYKLKKQQIQEWGLPGTAADYEEDHFISLELGGHPTDPRNLWPEPYRREPGAREKDVVETYLHRQVCAGVMTLQEAQKTIATDWYRIYLQIQE